MEVEGLMACWRWRRSRLFHKLSAAPDSTKWWSDVLPENGSVNDSESSRWSAAWTYDPESPLDILPFTRSLVEDPPTGLHVKGSFPLV